MHNVFLGTAKRTIETWLNVSILTSAHLEKVQQKVDKVLFPTNIGHLPGKIAK